MSLSDVKTTYDIFFSYSGADRAVVRNVARRLREARVTVWFDDDSLTPGANWQQELAARLMDSRACAVFVGPNDIVGWERYEMDVALNRSATDRDFRVFPVVLPGVDHFDPAATLPPFLATRQWVDLRPGPESADAIQELINALRGVAPQIAVTVDDRLACPYRGLEVFEEEHAPYFYGRKAQVQRLTEMLRQGRFLGVVGQSGVGKSSLVRAGLVPALRAESDRWRVLLLRPGVLPATMLTAQLLALHPRAAPTVHRLGTTQRMLNDAAVVALGDAPSGSKLLIVVDQFEEVFTLCRSLTERTAFLRNLLYAATYPRGPVVLVVVMRADFYPRLVEFPAFAQLAQSHQVLVPPMGVRELREVIIEPAYKVGLSIEQGLTDTILADVVREPGTLPLLQLALLETWQHRSGTMLTLEGYRATGGVSQALGLRAEDVYAGLSDAAREQARHVFLRLIQPGEGTEDTRRRVAINEITTGDDDAAAEVIQEFVAAYLLTTGTDEGTDDGTDDGADDRWVEISHEAVITGWARCARWVDEDRAGLLVHRRLTLAAQEWKQRGRSVDVLYRGVPLAEAQAWRTRAPGRLNWLEGDFLDAGAARERALRRSRRRKFTAVITALATAMVAIAVVAVMAVVQRNIAISRQLTAEANKALTPDPALALALALRAEDIASTTQSTEVLRQATADSRGRSVITSTRGPIYGARLLPDGRHAVTGSEDGSVDLWDLAARTLQRRLVQHSGRVYAVRLSPDGQTVASSGIDRTVRLTKVATGESRVVLTGRTPAVRTDFSHDGRLLAATFADGTVHVVDLAANREAAVLPVSAATVYDASFSADDALLATAARDGTVQIWRLADRTQLRVLRVAGAAYAVAFSPSTSQLAASGSDGIVRIWNGSTGALQDELAAGGGDVSVVRFSRDGLRLASGGLDGSIHVWDSAGLALAVLEGHGGRVQDVDFDRAGTTVLSAGADGTLRVWAPDVDVHRRTPVTTATFSRDGTRIVSGSPDGRLRVWRADDLTPVMDIADQGARSQAVFTTDGSRTISFGRSGRVTVRRADGGLLASFDPGVGTVNTVAPDPTDERLVVGGDNGKLVVADLGGGVLETLTTAGSSPVYAARFSPDGGSVLAGRLDGDLMLWGPDRRPLTIKPVDYRAVYDIAFSPDGTKIASADSSGGINLWTARGDLITTLPGHEGPAAAVRFRQGGDQVVTGGADGTVRVWDTHTGERLMTFPSTDGIVSYVDVDPAGRIVKSAENKQAMRLLTCEVCGNRVAVVELARARQFRTLTPDEERRFLAPD